MSRSPHAPLPPAKITDRFIAYLADLLPFGVGYYLSLYALVFRLGALPNTIEVWRGAFVAWLALYLLYQALGNRLGATPGKKLLGIRVVGRDGRALGLGRSVVRAFGYLVSTPLMNLGFLWSLFHPESRAWHDLMAGSVVVEARPKPPGAALLSALVSMVLIGALLVGNVLLYFGRSSPADLDALRKAKEGLRVLAAIEEEYKTRHGTYTDSLADLARASGDVGRFREAMEDLFDPDAFVFVADRDRYLLRARARDRRRTVVELAGPFETAAP
ncbi:MAG: RDD family protein [Elusimicrobiota bacterium]